MFLFRQGTCLNSVICKSFSPCWGMYLFRIMYICISSNVRLALLGRNWFLLASLLFWNSICTSTSQGRKFVLDSGTNVSVESLLMKLKKGDPGPSLNSPPAHHRILAGSPSHPHAPPPVSSSLTLGEALGWMAVKVSPSTGLLWLYLWPLSAVNSAPCHHGRWGRWTDHI